ncbi:MAG TPA: ATP-dependent zinc metalloprotease FtsH [Longimicrobiaceae bacterium]|nr:ATP-dependent zinc metalloprotease FtsH [Longimicrobiaceae bacterium]
MAETPNAPKGPRLGRITRTVSFWALLVVMSILLVQLASGGQRQTEEISWTQLRAQIQARNVAAVQIAGGLEGQWAQGDFHRAIAGARGNSVQHFRVRLPMANSQKLLDELDASGAVVSGKDTSGDWLSWLKALFPWLLIIGFWIFIFRQMQASGNKAFQFGKSKAKLLSGDTPKVTFDDVAGADEAKQELQEIVEFLKDPKRFSRLGGRIPKGALLVGPPGTGKTLLARAVAGEAGRPFFSMSGSDFVEMFVGVGASRVRDLFEQGKAHAPCIIFIDEIDAVGRHRGAGLGGGHDEREQTLNQLLVEMDGFEGNDGVILIAATNRPDVLDPALLRPGRFDRQIVVDSPDVRGREGILKVHLKKVPTASDVSVPVLARGTPGMSGADLANLVNEGALLAARRNKDLVYMADLEDAKDKVMLGAERRSLVMKDEERKLTAYHEAGHAVCAMKIPGNDPLHKVTIVPRGRALGLAFTLPEDDRVSVTRQQIEARLVMLYGGRAAEELVFGRDRVTTGAQSDIQRATGIARNYVTNWGLSDAVGPVMVGENETEVFLGRDLGTRRGMSESTAQMVDVEVSRIIGDAYGRAREVLEENIGVLHALAAALLERETLTREELEQIAEGKELPPFRLSPPVPPPQEIPEPLPAAAKERVPSGNVELKPRLA